MLRPNLRRRLSGAGAYSFLIGDPERDYPATGGKKGVASARNIQDLFLKIPAKCEIQEAGTTVYSQNGQSWNFPLKSGRLRVFLEVFRVSISLLDYVGCVSSVMTPRDHRYERALPTLMTAMAAISRATPTRFNRKAAGCACFHSPVAHI